MDLIRSAESFWERAGALWGATVHVIHRQTQADGGRRMVAYEWLCADPLARFAELYELMGMEWTPKAERGIGKGDVEGDTMTYSLHRPAAIQVDRWKDRVTPDQIESCRQFVEPFGLPYYPDFEPYVETFSGEAPVTALD